MHGGRDPSGAAPPLSHAGLSLATYARSDALGALQHV